jgi:hypothetical protein
MRKSGWYLRDDVRVGGVADGAYFHCRVAPGRIFNMLIDTRTYACRCLSPPARRR